MKRTFLALTIAASLLASCRSANTVMREPNTRLNLEKKDFTLSDQVTGEATSTQILCINFSRLFKNSSGSITKDGASSFASVYGSMTCDPTASYALYNLMKANPGYDVVFYPQYEKTVTSPIGICFLFKKTTVKTTARLGKLNK